MTRSTNWVVIRVTMALAAVVLSSGLVHQCLAQTGIPELPDPGTTRISREQQQQLGLQAGAEVYKQIPVLPDSSPETQYVRQVGQRLVATIPPEHSCPFEFHVIAQKEINAFALPGGEMFVNVGTIIAASNEAQLAGVMAHEMSHVYMQHSAKQMEKAQLTQGLVGLAGAILGNKGGALGSLAQAGVQVGAGMVMLKYSRSDEAQADEVGAVILYRAGYNPQAMVDFFKTLESQGESGPQFLSDHPNPGNREAAIQRETQGWPVKNYYATSSAFTEAHQHAIGVTTYTTEEIAQGAKSGRWEALNKQNGAVLKPAAGIAPVQTTPAQAGPEVSRTVVWSDVVPSSTLETTDLGPMRIDRPENWKVISPQQQGQALTIAPRAGVISAGIGYGVVIDGVSFTEKRRTVDEKTAEIVRNLQRGGGDLQQVGKTRSIKVAGVRGRSVTMQSTSPFLDAKGQSQKERDQLIAIPRPDGSVIFLVFVAPESEYERLSSTFERMLKSVQF